MMFMSEEKKAEEKKTKKKAPAKTKEKAEDQKAAVNAQKEAKAPEKEEAPKAHKHEAKEDQKSPAATTTTEAPGSPRAVTAPPEAAEAPKAAKESEPKKERKRKAPSKKATKVFVARGKRKTSIARATITPGKGIVRLNSQNVTSLPNRYIRQIILEPLRMLGPEANTVDISIEATGGGTMGQAQAARTAIANALVLFYDEMNLRDKFVSVDRSLVVEDTRRVESKKYRGPKARARYQKSYR